MVVGKWYSYELKYMNKEEIKKKIIKILEEEFGATITEIIFLGIIPKEKGHHQGFSKHQVIKNSSEKMANQILPLLEEIDKKEIIKEIEKWMVDRLPAFPPKGKAKEIFKMKLFSAEDIKAFLNKL